ncbi:hypothetical protein ACJMK2_025139 [Sinanodonta woodiana]|uniref:Uncharacterized protein n=1 Tax=Sinanodonta woodiana TaxID=1069815 RepID=A0ABD3XJD8_SINWO
MVMNYPSNHADNEPYTCKLQEEYAETVNTADVQPKGYDSTTIATVDFCNAKNPFVAIHSGFLVQLLSVEYWICHSICNASFIDKDKTFHMNNINNVL